MLFGLVPEVLFFLFLSVLSKFSLTCSDLSLSLSKTGFYSFLFLFFFFLIGILFLKVDANIRAVLLHFQKLRVFSFFFIFRVHSRLKAARG